MGQNKAALRKQMRARRREISLGDQRVFSHQILDQIASTSWWNTANVIGVFASLPYEVHTDALIALAQEQGKSVAFPVVVQREAPLQFRFGHTPQQSYPFEEGCYGIREPVSTSPKADLSKLDVVFFPLLGLDLQGNRLGYGQGYYDRTFSSFPMVRRVGLHYECQIVDRVPTNSFDLPLHGGVSETTMRVFEGPTQ